MRWPLARHGEYRIEALSASHDRAAFSSGVDAKDDDAQSFYERYGFERLPSAGRRLFLPLKEIATLFG